MINYSLVRGSITQTCRYLEQVIELLLKDGNSNSYFLSEVEYWLATLEMMRNSLYDCENTYKGEYNLLEIVQELLSEMSNSYVYAYKEISSDIRSELANAWTMCNEIKGFLLCQK